MMQSWMWWPSSKRSCRRQRKVWRRRRRPEQEDCAGVCFGSAVVDDCGVCAGLNALLDCDGVCGGSNTPNECGQCGVDPARPCVQDCNGDWACFEDTSWCAERQAAFED